MGVKVILPRRFFVKESGGDEGGHREMRACFVILSKS